MSAVHTANAARQQCCDRARHAQLAAHQVQRRWPDRAGDQRRSDHGDRAVTEQAAPHHELEAEPGLGLSAVSNGSNEPLIGPNACHPSSEKNPSEGK